MASIARLIRVTIENALANENSDNSDFDPLHDQMQSFRQVLLPDLTEAKFADLYSQTIAYGLFSARCNTKNPPFTRLNAGQAVPKTNPFLRQLFDNIAGINLDERITWAVDDLAELLNRSDMASILADFGKRTRQEDPVVHFYETFLTEYDPELRKIRGVYYTPEPVVSYIVRSVDKILQNDFGMPKGLGDSTKIKVKQGETEIESHRLLILDPATGTGTFLFSVIKQIFKRYENNKGMWDAYVSQHLLPRIFGFELLVAAYSVAHLKLGLLLEETDYKFLSNERLRVFLTNTLEEADRLANASGLTRWLNDEADSASRVKQDAPVMVVLGNPPYSGESANKGEWITKLMRGIDTHTGSRTENYFEVDGKSLGERNPKWVNNDYVKFIRFAQWKIEQTGYGVLAFITSNSYLDSPTFRGIRESLMQTFDEIYILDLHGNSKKKEKSPDGSEDKNVFDITEGVSIGFFVKKQKENNQEPIVFHKHLYGVREVFTKDKNDEIEITGGKYHWLLENDITTTDWIKLSPNSPYYLFIPQDETLRKEYEENWKLSDIFLNHGVGITTARDSLTIQFDEKTVWEVVNDFVKLDVEIARTKYNLRKDARDWKIKYAQQDLKNSGLSKEKLGSILYRPFDIQYTYYTGKSKGFHCMPRSEIMFHMAAGNNLALCTNRQVNKDFHHVFCSQLPINDCTISNATKERTFLFPLYLYPTEQEKRMTKDERLPNFSDEFIKDFSAKLRLKLVLNGKSDLEKTFAPEDVFNYAYAIFHSAIYRSRYAGFLKMDFPRLPLTSNLKLFRLLVSLGSQLVSLHLMEKDIESDISFPVKGSNKVEFVPSYEDKKVRINENQYFSNVPETVWEFHIGGYCPAEKWLKDRKDRILSFDDLEHYEKIVSVISQTIELMQQIDEIIEDNGGFPIE